MRFIKLFHPSAAFLRYSRHSDIKLVGPLWGSEEDKEHVVNRHRLAPRYCCWRRDTVAEGQIQAQILQIHIQIQRILEVQRLALTSRSGTACSASRSRRCRGTAPCWPARARPGGPMHAQHYYHF